MNTTADKFVYYIKWINKAQTKPQQPNNQIITHNQKIKSRRNPSQRRRKKKNMRKVSKRKMTNKTGITKMAKKTRRPFRKERGWVCPSSS